MLPWTFMYKILCGHMFSSLLSIPSSGIACSYGNSMLNILRNFQTVFHSDCTILHSHHQRMSVLVSLHPCQPLHLSYLFYFSHLSGCEVISHCSVYIYLPDGYWCWASFMGLLAICIFSLEKCQFRSFAYILIGLSFYCWFVGVLYIFWIQVPYQIL